MPTYEFVCQDCDNRFELVIKLEEYEKQAYTCPECGSRQLEQQISSFQTITSSKS